MWLLFPLWHFLLCLSSRYETENLRQHAREGRGHCQCFLFRGAGGLPFWWFWIPSRKFKTSVATIQHFFHSHSTRPARLKINDPIPNSFIFPFGFQCHLSLVGWPGGTLQGRCSNFNSGPSAYSSRVRRRHGVTQLPHSFSFPPRQGRGAQTGSRGFRQPIPCQKAVRSLRLPLAHIRSGAASL